MGRLGRHRLVARQGHEDTRPRRARAAEGYEKRRYRGASRSMITHALLLSLIHYNPRTGVFTRLAIPNGSGRGKRPVASVAATPKGDGYMRVYVDGRRYSAHRLAFFYMMGRWPDPEVDHKDGDGSNNRWRNLRESTRAANQQNQRRAQRSNRHSRLLGVKKNGNGWTAKIVFYGLSIGLGTYGTPAEAHAVYVRAKRSLHASCMI